MIYAEKIPTSRKVLVWGPCSASLGLLAAVATLLAACGGSPANTATQEIAGSAGEAGAAPALGEGGTSGKAGSSAGGAAGAVDCDQRVTKSSVLNESIFHSGFEVALGTAVLTPATESCAPGDLVIDATFHNRGGDAFQFGPEMLVTSGGNDYAYSPSSYTDIPAVPGGRTGKGTLHFNVDTKFDLNDATLIVGGAYEHKAVVPLGAKSPDTFVSLDPPDATLMGKFTAGTLQFDMKGGYIRADQPWDHTTLDEDHYSITLLFSATYIASTGLGGDNISRDNFDLLLPDGTAVAPDDAPVELLDNLGTTLDDLSMTFTVPGPMEGKFALEASGRWGKNDAAVSIAMPFVVPHIAAFGK